MTANDLPNALDRYAESITDYEYDLPEDGPEARCPYCDRPFATERTLAFHLGAAHDDRWTDEERAAYEAELDDEETDLFTFHLKAAVSVFLIYFLFTFFYALAWVGRF